MINKVLFKSVFICVFVFCICEKLFGMQEKEHKSHESPEYRKSIEKSLDDIEKQISIKKAELQKIKKAREQAEGQEVKKKDERILEKEQEIKELEARKNTKESRQQPLAPITQIPPQAPESVVSKPLTTFVPPESPKVKEELIKTSEKLGIESQQPPFKQLLEKQEKEEKTELKDVGERRKVTEVLALQEPKSTSEKNAPEKLEQKEKEAAKKWAKGVLEKLATKKGGAVGALAAIGAVLLGGGGITGGIEGFSAKDEGDSDMGGVFPPSIHEDPPIGNVEYDHKLYLIANAYSSIQDKFKEAIQTGDYNNPVFEINIGNVTIGKKEESVAIKYIFENGGSGNLDSPLSPVLIEITPDSIDDYAVTPDRLVNQIDNEDVKEFVSMLLKPSSALIFFIKMGLLMNSGKEGDYVANANTMLLEGTLLSYRLTLDKNYSTVSTQSLLSDFPLWLQNYSNDSKAKMFVEMIKIYSENYKTTSSVEDAVSKVRQLAGYRQKIKATKDTLFPLINTKLTYSDKTILTHAILRLIADLGTKVPAEITAQKKEIVERLDALIPIITEASTIVTRSAFESKFADKIIEALNTIKEIRAGTKKIQQNISKPRLGDLSTDTTDCSMTTIINICLQHFLRLSSKKFEGDYGFLSNDLLLGIRKTKDAMLAVWLRCMKDAVRANNFLYKTTATAVMLKNFGGTFSVDPRIEYKKIIGPREEALASATADLSAAIKLLKEAKNSANIKNYTKLKAAFDLAAQKYVESQHSFTRAYSVFYQISQDDDSSRTVAEFAQKEFAILTKIGVADKETLKQLFDGLANKFEPFLGLPRDMIWD